MSTSARTLAALELPAILAKVADHAAFSLSREQVRRLVPATDPDSVRRLLNEVSEARDALEINPGLTVGAVRDIRSRLEAARVESRLDAADLLTIAGTIRGAAGLRTGLANVSEVAPGLAEFARQIDPLPHLAAAISRCIADDGDILDSASPALARVRSEGRKAQQRLHTGIERVLQAERRRDHIQEAIYTERSGRLVIPIKNEYRREFPGVIHDISATGLTVFMEPLEVVELNNEWHRLQLEERNEIDRVLAELTGAVAESVEILERNLSVAAEIDVALARARYAHSTDATYPEVAADRSFTFLQARHPLLGAEAVPLDIALGPAHGFNAVLITGPNTGGKTVALKTVGLLHLMAACGLHIPAADGSRVAVYEQLFADIGDEQSIEQSLSTFSSHMSNLIEMVDRAGAGDLVLADEIGAGTDPAEGAALARAIVESLLDSGGQLVATTHIAELKHFAYQHANIENASVEFDLATLSPTYVLRMGLAGASNAIDIAARLGLSAGVIERARELAGGEHEATEQLLDRLRRDTDAAEEDRRQAAAELEAARETRAGATESVEAAEDREAEHWRQTRREARGLLRQMQSLARETERAARGEDQGHLRDAIRAGRELQESLDDSGYEPGDPADPVRDLPVVRPGDRVRLRGLRGSGEVISVDSAGHDIEIMSGAMRMRVAPEEIESVESNPTPPRPPNSTARPVPIPSSGYLEVDLHGLRVEAAAEAIEESIDRAIFEGRKYLHLIHGRGTGALRSAVRRHLNGHPLVNKFADATPHEGGSGTTVVDLRG
jgi:DNA mismatch repair protein MutS2